ncbi:MAG TPA: hypothetical protein VFM29_00150, partial [Vicinamibacteria bacterium]|nr:hypothetical protein [Vicinamibacteria bacterium]
MARQELGEILRQAELVSQAQLTEALSLQRVYGERLASVLVRQNILTEKFAVTYLGRQLGVPSVDLSRQEIDLALLELVPLEMCERHLVFPLRVEGTRLLLAMSDPLDQKLVAEIEFKSGTRLAPVIALEASIKNAILEARRAQRAGLKKIHPHVQKPKEAAPATPPAAPAGPEAEAAEQRPIAVKPLEESQERAIFETLGGARIGNRAP